jgi:L-threonylcarbamoyladenylate synthase
MLNKKLPIYLSWQNPKTILKIKESIENNNVIISTTDTVIGLLTNATIEGLETLNKLKGARVQNPYIILIKSIDILTKFIDQNTLTPQFINFLKLCWPGSVTIIFKAHSNLPCYLKGPNNTIALRCPNHKGLLSLLSHFNGLFSTSANTSGEKTPRSLKDIEPVLLQNVTYLVGDYKNIDTCIQLEQTFPSTLIDTANQDYIKVIRTGAYPIDLLEKQYGKKFEK